jgi:hypothetical protein
MACCIVLGYEIDGYHLDSGSLILVVYLL